MKVSELVFACHSAACRPPGSGGTGGSSPAGDVRSRRFDRKIRSGNDSVRAAASKALAESIYSGATPIFHGSRSSSIKVGDIIRPTESGGSNKMGLAKAAFASRNIATTGVFGGHLYQVEPVHRDIEFLPTSGMGVHIASPSGFRVTKVLKDVKTVPDQADMDRLFKGVDHRQRQSNIQKARRERRASRIATDNPELDAKIVALVDILLKKSTS